MVRNNCLLNWRGMADSWAFGKALIKQADRPYVLRMLLLIRRLNTVKYHIHTDKAFIPAMVYWFELYQLRVIKYTGYKYVRNVSKFKYMELFIVYFSLLMYLIINGGKILDLDNDKLFHLVMLLVFPLRYSWIAFIQWTLSVELFPESSVPLPELK